MTQSTPQLDAVKSYIEAALQGAGVQYEITFESSATPNEPPCYGVASITRSQAGFFFIHKDAFQGIIFNQAAEAYYRNEGFDEDTIQENLPIYLQCRDVDHFLSYLLP